MSVVIVTGSGGLVGAEATRFFAGQGFIVAGIDNDMRKEYFGPEASTAWAVRRLEAELPDYRHHHADVRDAAAMERIFAAYGTSITCVIHAAAQPSHDWAGRAPRVDFEVNAGGTLNLLECTRNVCPDAVFIFTSSNKVYGDRPNTLPFEELETRWELPRGHAWYSGIDESMSMDQSLHSVFGAMKVAADILVQEYGRYFGLKTMCFRCGCLTGPGHAGAELHGFLAYLMMCCVLGRPYQIIGYKGKQVRDNIHCHDLVQAFYHAYKAPRPGEVYNMGGGRASNCSVREAIALCEEITGNRIATEYSSTARRGDHMWWISGIEKFRSHYPEWQLTYDLRRILEELYTANTSDRGRPVNTQA